MGFASESGYTPNTVQELMLLVMDGVNDQFGTTYTEETFVGTNFYKYFYALVQLLQENEVKTSEIFLSLQQYFDITNESISRPVVTNPGIIEVLADAGYTASVKQPEDADAGKIFIAVDVDETETDPDYETVTKPAIAEIIKNSVVAGVISQGAESESIVLTNGQSFDFKYDLPDRTEVLLKLTVTLSENNMVVVGDPDDVKQALIDNIEARYSLGKNFEPQKYFDIDDAPWASQVVLEYSVDDGMNYETEVFDAEYDELFVVLLENIELIED